MTRDALRSFLSTRILAFDLPHPVRVAIDGVAGSGKTTLANELAPLCANAGRDVVRASIRWGPAATAAIVRHCLMRLAIRR
jgi:uridine kinase